MDQTLEVKQLSICFKNKHQSLRAVDQVSFNLYPSETLALLGESGCGKSITAFSLMRLLPESAFYGNDSKVSLNDQDLLELPEKQMQSMRGLKIAMIFQEPMTALNPVLTIGQQISEAIKQHQTLSRKERNAKVLSLLQEVDIPNPELRQHQYPHQLSGGQKQRVVIAMALASTPNILIADEPTTALDVTVQAQILALLKKLQEKYQMSILLITHDLSVVKAVADRVCIMYAGQVVETGKVNDFFERPLHPYAQELLLALPDIKKRGQKLHAITGMVPSLDAMPTGCRFHPRCKHAFSHCTQIEPPLISINNQCVRCHLYPDNPVKAKPLTASSIIKAGRPPAKKILEVKDLSVQFTANKSLFQRNKPTLIAVNQLSFELHAGKTLALVGESGCGKTTTARSIIGLQPPSSGSISLHGQNIRHFNKKELRVYRKQVQMIFQDPFSAMNPRMTVAEILAEGMIVQGLKKSPIQKRIKNLLEQVNLPQSSLHRYPHQFSGGQRQRICIARALATDPEILICDEPTSALDISVQAQILNLLKEIQEEQGIAYLFITHNMAVVSYIADDVLVMKDGKKVEEGTTETIFSDPQSFYTQKLVNSVLPMDT